MEEKTGKNDGSVGDYRYFTCPPGYGVLAKPSRLALAENGNSRQPATVSVTDGMVSLATVVAGTTGGPSMGSRRYADGVATLHTDDNRPITWLDEDDASSQATDPQPLPQYDLTDALSL